MATQNDLRLDRRWLETPFVHCHRLLVASVVSSLSLFCSLTASAREFRQEDWTRILQICGAGIEGSEIKGKIGVAISGLTPEATLEGEYKGKVKAAFMSEPSIPGPDKIRMFELYLKCAEDQIKSVTTKYPAIHFVDEVDKDFPYGETSMLNVFSKVYQDYVLIYKNTGEDEVTCSVLVEVGILRSDGEFRPISGASEKERFNLGGGDAKTVKGSIKHGAVLRSGEKYKVNKTLRCWYDDGSFAGRWWRRNM